MKAKIEFWLPVKGKAVGIGKDRCVWEKVSVTPTVEEWENTKDLAFLVYAHWSNVLVDNDHKEDLENYLITTEGSVVYQWYTDGKQPNMRQVEHEWNRGKLTTAKTETLALVVPEQEAGKAEIEQEKDRGIQRVNVDAVLPRWGMVEFWEKGSMTPSEKGIPMMLWSWVNEATTMMEWKDLDDLARKVFDCWHNTLWLKDRDLILQDYLITIDREKVYRYYQGVLYEIPSFEHVKGLMITKWPLDEVEGIAKEEKVVGTPPPFPKPESAKSKRQMDFDISFWSLGTTNDGERVFGLLLFSIVVAGPFDAFKSAVLIAYSEWLARAKRYPETVEMPDPDRMYALDVQGIAFIWYRGEVRDWHYTLEEAAVAKDEAIAPEQPKPQQDTKDINDVVDGTSSDLYMTWQDLRNWDVSFWNLEVTPEDKLRIVPNGKRYGTKVKAYTAYDAADDVYDAWYAHYKAQVAAWGTGEKPCCDMAYGLIVDKRKYIWDENDVHLWEYPYIKTVVQKLRQKGSGGYPTGIMVTASPVLNPEPELKDIPVFEAEAPKDKSTFGHVLFCHIEGDGKYMKSGKPLFSCVIEDGNQTVHDVIHTAFKKWSLDYQNVGTLHDRIIPHPIYGGSYAVTVNMELFVWDNGFIYEWESYKAEREEELNPAPTLRNEDVWDIAFYSTTSDVSEFGHFFTQIPRNKENLDTDQDMCNAVALAYHQWRVAYNKAFMEYQAARDLNVMGRNVVVPPKPIPGPKSSELYDTFVNGMRYIVRSGGIVQGLNKKVTKKPELSDVLEPIGVESMDDKITNSDLDDRIANVLAELKARRDSQMNVIFIWVVIIVCFFAGWLVGYLM